MNAALKRSDTLAALTQQPLDVLVIGGGIVGAGVARDAAMRGLRTGLVEQHDFAFGTSGRSSRLLHGGIRYLAQGRLKLVREASLEKAVLQRIAPHLAAPLPFIFPIYPNSPWPLWQMRIGVKLYDALCGGKNFGKSSSLSARETERAAPALLNLGLRGAVRYYDGFTNDARLVLDTIRSAAAHQARVVNYCHFEDASPNQDGWRCVVMDQVSGRLHEIQTHTVVNASGPWASRLPHSAVKLRLTKGIHLVIDRDRLRMDDAIVLTEGKRILFVIPWGERTILGTTDTDYSGSLDDVHADASDIEYVLKVANQFFPSAKLGTADIISTWAGLRPLLADNKGGASDISRAHQIKSPEPYWWDVAGGKLTTYRLMAEQTVNKLIAAARIKAGQCSTASEPLVPARQPFSGILPPPFSEDAVKYFSEHEWVLHLDDLMIRRTSWHYYLKDAAAKANQAASWMAASLGWSEAEKMRELEHYRSINLP